ncbi:MULTISPECIES: DNA ligase [unclassified Oceanobacter]|uniref:DNA ligase n=1 Tax=unclassified Oceanobacter TaxID=2620260 RepID=UPI0026E32A64|nr:MULTISPECIES: DNA ligase [unclassified Oceanobacter]MDO6683743.1 DNA ligase [Oceanobacter sp. 5_MG-2023]MDP2507276.1 DNA ligase [Oceanobacter sp. 3_MG-2023]
MDMIWLVGLILALVLSAFPLKAFGDRAPPLMLAKTWQETLSPAAYLVSEKLDGVRAYWDGEQLLSRSGLMIHAPDWFLSELPSQPLDGELWAGRGAFEQVSQLVRSTRDQGDAWRAMRFMALDLPASPATFEERYRLLQALVARQQSPYLETVVQETVNDRAALQARLKQVVAAGGEGLMLKRRQSLYQAHRSDDLLKYKLWQDAEGRVVGYVPGNGKYQGMTGALRVVIDDGREIRLGSGLTDALRQNPPAVGTWVTYAFSGYTVHGLPRFARFVRVRQKE